MNMTQHKSGLRWLWLAVLAFVLDQASKLAVVKLLPFGYPGVEITPFFNLVHVYNFLDFYWQRTHWPAFNLADSFIFIGAAMIVLDGFRGEKKQDATS